MTILLKNQEVRITQLCAGQPRPYADSEYRFLIESPQPLTEEQQNILRAILEPCEQTYAQFQGPDGVYWNGYYTWQELPAQPNSSEYRYEYCVWRPFCD